MFDVGFWISGSAEPDAYLEWEPLWLMGKTEEEIYNRRLREKVLVETDLFYQPQFKNALG
ncbi:hypothetical protein [Almyronema epifaneia]|uniref:Uncharacterized protein n=1 Tax=Almyronema epifaneia S1 TaxID=2991925 RepID=A0ABW6IKQ9_9CYAN